MTRRSLAALVLAGSALLTGATLLAASCRDREDLAPAAAAATRPPAPRASPTAAPSPPPLLPDAPDAFRAAAINLPAQDAVMRVRDGCLLWTRGFVADWLDFGPGGEFRVAVEAWGSPAENEWPRLHLLLDQLGQAVVAVESREPRVYQLVLRAPPGVHQLGLGFSNDRYVSREEDRNLGLARLAVAPAAGTNALAPRRAPVPTRLAFAPPARTDAELEAEARANIERLRRGELVLHVTDAAGRPVAGAVVALEQLAHAFRFGTILANPWNEKTPAAAAGRSLLPRVFNFATIENMLKWRQYEPEEGKPLLARVEEALAWSAAQGVEPKGHCLIWGNSIEVPDWALAGDGAAVAARLERRVSETVARYRGRIRTWDVVNEPLHMRLFEETAGGGYVARAFRAARAADPDAELVLNEYGILGPNAALQEAYYVLLDRLIQDGVPLDAIGLQAHPGATWLGPGEIWPVLDRFARLGKPLHLTEFLVYGPTGEEIKGGRVAGKWDPKLQAAYYRQFYTLAFGHPAVAALTNWGFVDPWCWWPEGGLLDAEGRAKPAYETLEQLIRREWWTRATVQTAADGSARLRGFGGRYRLSVTPVPGQGLAARELTLELKAGVENPLEVKLEAVAPLAPSAPEAPE